MPFQSTRLQVQRRHYRAVPIIANITIVHLEYEYCATYLAVNCPLQTVQLTPFRECGHLLEASPALVHGSRSAPAEQVEIRAIGVVKSNELAVEYQITGRKGFNSLCHDGEPLRHVVAWPRIEQHARTRTVRLVAPAIPFDLVRPLRAHRWRLEAEARSAIGRVERGRKDQRCCSRLSSARSMECHRYGSFSGVETRPAPWPCLKGILIVGYGYSLLCRKTVSAGNLR
jgi:hypothetical protein